MKTLYLDCGMGAAGGHAGGGPAGAAAGPGGVCGDASWSGAARGGLYPGEKREMRRHRLSSGSHRGGSGRKGEEHPHSHDHHGHSHEHRNLHDIRHLVEDHLQLPEAVRGDILAVYDRIAQAESRVHGVPVEDIHFHEVGTLDAVADITAVCLLIHTPGPGGDFGLPRCGWAAARCGAPMGCCRFRPLPQRFCCGRRPFMPETWQGSCAPPRERRF